MFDIEYTLVPLGMPRDPRCGVILYLGPNLPTVQYDTQWALRQEELVLLSPCCGRRLEAPPSYLARGDEVYCAGCGYELYPDARDISVDLDGSEATDIVTEWFEYHGEVLQAHTMAYDVITWVQRLRSDFTSALGSDDGCSPDEYLLQYCLAKLGAKEWLPAYARI